MTLSADTNAFLDGFFGMGNAVWPDRDPTSRTGRNLGPYLRILTEASDTPVILPRRRPGNSDLLAYVIARRPAHVTVVAELLTAFVGPTYSIFDGRTSRLSQADPVERAILEFFGPNTTFVLASPSREASARAWKALDLLLATLTKQPVRTSTMPKPVGRLLAEFELALAAGDAAASATVLDHLSKGGGLNGLNVVQLRIKRLSKLGRDDELLRLPELTDVVRTDPPIPVKNAILAAIYERTLAGPLEDHDLDLARQRLMDRGDLVPALLTGGCDGLDAEALTVLCAAAWARGDIAVLRRLLPTAQQRDQVHGLSPELLAAVDHLTRSYDRSQATEERPAEQPTGTTGNGEGARTATSDDRMSAVSDHGPEATAVPTSWLEWVRALKQNGQQAQQPAETELWRTWPSPAAADAELARALAILDDEGAERVWSMVGAFVDADAYKQPAALAAREFISNAVTYGRYSPGDLAGLVALTEIYLRSAPGPVAYAALLDDLQAECGRWVAPERATVALDLADLLVRAACPDTEASLRLALALLGPLHVHHSRLTPDQASFAQQVSNELATGLQWPDRTEAVVDAEQVAAVHEARVLLYSLDRSVLGRVSEALHRLLPNLKIHQSHDYVATDQLRQRSRNADVIVLATRCAKHAATGFIRANAGPHAVVVDAEGSGSASLLRAAITALRQRR